LAGAADAADAGITTLATAAARMATWSSLRALRKSDPFFPKPLTELADGFEQGRRSTAQISRIHPNYMGPRFAGQARGDRHGLRDSAALSRRGRGWPSSGRDNHINVASLRQDQKRWVSDAHL
jgi:hypothetical protein